MYYDDSALYCSVALRTAAVVNRPTNGQTERREHTTAAVGPVSRRLSETVEVVRRGRSGGLADFEPIARFVCVCVCLFIRPSV